MNRRLEVRITVIDTKRSPESYRWFKVRKSLGDWENTTNQQTPEWNFL
jgi:hypothetical protein